MIRGTTPTLEFALPFEVDLIAEAYVTISQNQSVVIDKSLSELTCAGKTLTVTYGSPTATNITLGISDGKLTGLPSGLSGGSLLVTRGI